MNLNDTTGQIIGSAIEVHKAVGPGLLETVYEECLCQELESRSIAIQRQLEVAIEYKGNKLVSGYRIDLLVDNEIIVELKACDRILPIHEAQLLTYLKMTKKEIGLLINFNVPILKDGIKRMRI